MNSSENSLNYTSNMPRSRRLTRSSIPSARSLSCSEDENDDISVQSIVRPRTSSSNHLRRTIEQEANSQNLLSNNHASYDGGVFSRYADRSDGDSLSHFSESSHTSRLTVQNSLFHRIRWILWRCTYLKIIRTVNFDVWVLSRLHNYGKYKAIFFLLLPLILFLVTSINPHNPFSTETLSQALNSSSASISPVISPVFSFVQKYSQILYAGWFVKTNESTYSRTKEIYNIKQHSDHQTEEIKPIQSNKEEIEMLLNEVISMKNILKTATEGIETNRISQLEKELKIQTEINNLQFEIQSITRTMGNLEKGVKKQSEKDESKEAITVLTNKYDSEINHLKLKMNVIEEKLNGLLVLKSCCDKQWNEKDLLAFLENHLLLAFKNVIDGDPDPNSKYHFFNVWLSSKFSSHEKKMMQLIDTALRKEAIRSKEEMNYDSVMRVVESTIFKYVDSIKKNLSELNKSSYSNLQLDVFSEDRVKQIVKEAIMLYDADKIGQVDYALESGGGSVLGTRCSETYVEKYGKLSIFGVPLWTDSNSPRTAIQPDVHPGRCWAFKGSQGFLVIELSATIHPTGFTLEHIPVSLSPTGTIDSAPKNFSVWGLDSEKDSKGDLLGQYWYDISREPLQYFAVQKPRENPYSYVELQIHSNHGNMEYTCLYRFRVHGRRVR